MWEYKTPGIPDEYFERIENIPITKEEVRVIQLSKARLKSGQTVYDVGCGSGSISVEAGLLVGNDGHVYSIDINPKAIELTKKNLDKFSVSNVSVFLNSAIEKIPELPNADTIFIGGTGNDTREIVGYCVDKLKPRGRIVIGTILVETLYSILDFLKDSELKSIDITQVTISKSKKTSTGTMMLARNPVTIISGSKTN